MELRDLYDDSRNLIGRTIKKDEKPLPGFYITTVIIFIQNENNEFLIQKRSKDKGGKWATTGGHPKTGETSLEGLVTEVKEEIGISLNKEDVKLFKTIKTSTEFFDMYYVKMEIDLKDIVIQEEEVSDVKWASVEEINKLVSIDEFHKGHGMVFNYCFEYLNINQ